MTTEKFIITKDAAYAMVDNTSSEVDKVFSWAQASVMRRRMAEDKRWEQVDPKEALRVELTLDGDNMSTVYYAFDKNLIALFEELLEKEEKSIIIALNLHERTAEDGESY
jgi:hypothetical protein